MQAVARPAKRMFERTRSQSHPRVSVADLEPVGRDLHRPECVLADPSGTIYVPDWRGGITRLDPEGSQHTCLARATADLRPNGIALAPDGSMLLANLGHGGGVWRLHPDGRLDPYLAEIDGRPLPPANFVLVDDARRTWISVSTWRTPRQLAWRAGIADGFIVLVDDAGARIVADGLHYANEVRVDPSGTWLYAVETFARRLTRFRIGADGTLNARETVAALGHGCFPDGVAFDDRGAVWLTSLVTNRLMRIAGGEIETVLEDVNPSFVTAAERAFAAGRLDAAHLGPIDGTRLQQLTSLAFGGPDGRTVYLGSLHAPCLYRFRAEVGGAPQAHWSFGATFR